MKNELKRACTFYLGSWWLPQLLVFMVLIIGNSFKEAISGQAIKFGIDYGETVRVMLFSLCVKIMTVSWCLAFLLVLGWLSSWIWFLIHKQWRKAWISFFLMMFIGQLCDFFCSLL